MRVLIASSHPYIPQIAGGAQSSSHELALNLQSRGHSVALLCGLLGKGRLGLRSRVMLKLTGRKAAMDEMLGYPVHRSWFAWEAGEEVCAAFRPHAIILQSGHAGPHGRGIAPSGAVIIPYFRNVEFERISAAIRARSGRIGASRTRNSPPTPIGELSASNPSSFIHSSSRSVIERKPMEARFFSSIRFPKKGSISQSNWPAALPRHPFYVRRGVDIGCKARSTLKAALAALRNVTLVPRRRDMRERLWQSAPAACAEPLRGGLRTHRCGGACQRDPGPRQPARRPARSGGPGGRAPRHRRADRGVGQRRWRNYGPTGPPQAALGGGARLFGPPRDRHRKAARSAS